MGQRTNHGGGGEIKDKIRAYLYTQKLIPDELEEPNVTRKTNNCSLKKYK